MCDVTLSVVSEAEPRKYLRANTARGPLQIQTRHPLRHSGGADTGGDQDHLQFE